MGVSAATAVTASFLMAGSSRETGCYGEQKLSVSLHADGTAELVLSC